MILAYLLIIACGILAVAYGYQTGREVLAADAGTSRMQEIAGAVQEGARAYLTDKLIGLGLKVLISLPTFKQSEAVEVISESVAAEEIL